MTATTTTSTKSLRIRALAALATLAVAASMLIAIAAKPAHAESTTFTVNSTNDRGDGACNSAECTLTEAINFANATPGADVINFNIPGSGVHTIKPSSPLPDITERVTIDGYTQGSSTADTADDAKPNTLAQGAINAVLMIELDGSNAGSGARGLQIAADGSGSVVKGLAIHSFSRDGIFMASGSTQNKIEGNFIGSDPSGTLKGNNGGSGVNSVDSTFNTVGGSSPAARNLISGNAFGVFVSSASDNNRVEHNLIGTQKDGTTALGNIVGGVFFVGASNNTVSGNTIAFNGGEGVVMLKDSRSNNNAISNLLAGNSIFSNGGLGIDLNRDDVTANDADDPNTGQVDPDSDAGPNELQNFPLLSSAKTTKKGTTITGTLNSTPNKTFTLQFFSNPSGGDEGQKFLGQLGVTTDASGDASFSFKPTQKVSRGQFITATARDSSSLNTSEFSAAKKVVRPR